MPEWLQDSFLKDEGLATKDIFVRLGLALALGCVVAGIYRLSQRRGKGQTSNLVPTLVLLTVLIAMVTLVIGSNIARAFSLVGALAIVRFRTVVEDTRDTAFVIFAVAVGMAIGAGFRDIPLIGILLAGLAAFLFRSRAGVPAASPAELILSIRLGAGHRPDVMLRDIFSKHLERHSFQAMATARQGAALDVTYHVRLRREDSAMDLVAELNALEGVQGVELRQS